MTNNQDNDLLALQDSEDESAPSQDADGWKVLIVDDDDDVHKITVFGAWQNADSRPKAAFPARFLRLAGCGLSETGRRRGRHPA